MREFTKETRLKMSLNHADVSGNKNPMHGKKRPEVGIRNKLLKTGIKLSKEHIAKCSASLKGKLTGEKNPTKRKEVREKISSSLKKKFVNGWNPWLGRKHSIETKKKISKTRIDKQLAIGKNNPMWKAGIAYEPYTLDFNNKVKRAIMERDNYTCQICGSLQYDISFPIHHINYNKLDSNYFNLITLCISCHSKTNVNRKYWEYILGQVIKLKYNRFQN